jgi:hypothetical protein
MKISKQKRSLKDLIERLEWFAIENPKVSRSMVDEDTVLVTFGEDKKHPDKINKVFVRFGKNVLYKLEWKPRDKILPLFSPDDHMLFMMVKSDRNIGFTLAQEHKIEIYRLQFTWNRSTPLQKMPATPVEYEVYKKQLIFRVGESSEDIYD